MIEHLRQLTPETVEQFLTSHNAEVLNIPQKLAEYILQINAASNLKKETGSISMCAEKLQKEFPELSIHTCKNRIYDAIKYFNSPSAVIADEWNMFFADRMMGLSQKNEEAGDLKEARLSLEKAREYYLEATSKQVNPELIRFKPQIVSPDFLLERMGVTGVNVLEAHRKLKAIISEIDATDSEKKRLLEESERELNITEVKDETIG